MSWILDWTLFWNNERRGNYVWRLESSAWYTLVSAAITNSALFTSVFSLTAMKAWNILSLKKWSCDSVLLSMDVQNTKSSALRDVCWTLLCYLHLCPNAAFHPWGSCKRLVIFSLQKQDQTCSLQLQHESLKNLTVLDMALPPTKQWLLSALILLLLPSACFEIVKSGTRLFFFWEPSFLRWGQRSSWEKD